MSRAQTRRLTRRRFMVLAAAGLAAGGSAAVVTARSSGGVEGPGAGTGNPPGAGGSGDASPERTTVAVTRRDLSQTVKASGTVGYGDTRAVVAAGAGTITALPEIGTVVRPDQALYQVDGRDGPVLLSGELPMWRDLDRWVEDGADVTQVETNLVALDVAETDLTVDDEFTWLTAEAVAEWQESHGRGDTGRLGKGDVWFSPAPVRVSSLTASVGDPASGEIMRVTGTDRRVYVAVDSSYGNGLEEGGAVTLTLPDGSEVAGTASYVADVVTVAPASEPGRPDTSTIGVVVTPHAELDVRDETPVGVAFQVDTISDVLAVPVDAVVATTDGRYALELVDGDGSTHLEEVSLGRFAGGWVQVAGDVEEGQEVLSA